MVPAFKTATQLGIDYLDKLFEKPDDVFYTGLQSIDDAAQGLHRGEMCILAARPSHGKSLMGLQWSQHVAQCDFNTMFVSLEMGERAIAKRLLARATKVEPWDWRDRSIDVQRDFDSFWHERERMYVTCTPRTVTEVRETIDHAAQELNVAFVVVDYLQIIQAAGTDRERVSVVSREMKRAATENDIGLVCLAQLGRDFDNGEKPKMSHLQHSSQMEQDADQILFVDWPRQADAQYDDPHEYRAFGIKNRERGWQNGQRVFALRIKPSRQLIHETQAADMPNYDSQFDDYNANTEGF